MYKYGTFSLPFIVIISLTLMQGLVFGIIPLCRAVPSKLAIDILIKESPDLSCKFQFIYNSATKNHFYLLQTGMHTAMEEQLFGRSQTTYFLLKRL